MMTKNPMQLKAFIKNKAAEKHISAQLVMQNYRLLPAALPWGRSPWDQASS